MAPKLPPRYQLEVRLGNDGDAEEWLATDTSLERPVLLRFLPAETDQTRAAQFLDHVRAAAAVSHTHVATIYAAGTLDGTTYSISEWAGGMTLADRTAAAEPIPPEEFLPNAAGLSGGLAALHAVGIVHGAIDSESILFSAAHPAKIAGFGRETRWVTQGEDVQSLAALLETTLTGRPVGAALPSQVVDAVPSEVDHALEQGRTGEVNAMDLAASLRSAPLLAPTRRRLAGWSWRWVSPAIALFVAAALLVILGSSLAGSDSSSVSTIAAVQNTADAPVAESPPRSVDVAPEPTADSEPSVVTSSATAVAASAYDPFGTDGEHDELADRAIDGDFATAWKTESYLSPLPALKQGVGLIVSVEGSSSAVEITGARDGTVFQLYWATDIADNFDAWTIVSEGTISNGGSSLTFPSTDDGHWLIWFTDLPATDEGTYTGSISEVRFRS